MGTERERERKTAVAQGGWAGGKSQVQTAPRDSQEPCGQKDSVTAGWEADLKKGGGERCKEEEKSQGAGREIADGRREIKGIQAGREKRKEKGRHSERDGQTETSRQPRKTRRRWTEKDRWTRGGMEKPGPPKPSGHPWMEQTVAHGGESGPRTG